MTGEPPPLQHSQKVARTAIIQEMFLRTADEDYITARWAMANRMISTFCWLAAHCLEKYLKAVLLMNGRSALRQSHRIVDLYDEVAAFAGDLLPAEIARPEWVEERVWHRSTARAFMERIADNGQPENRYLVHGYMILEQDLFALDQMVWFIRRIVARLEDRIGRDIPDAPTWREVIQSRHHVHSPIGMYPLDEVIAGRGATQEAAAALFNRNFAFASESYPHSGIMAGSASINPVIYRQVLELLDHPMLEAVQEAIETGEWLLDHILLSRGSAAIVRQALERARRRIADAEPTP